MTDWPKIIAEILTTRLTRNRIAAMCGVDHKTVKAWASGKSEPGYSAGVLLLELRADVPRGILGKKSVRSSAKPPQLA